MKNAHSILLAGTVKQCLGTATPAEFKRATHALGTMRRFAEFAGKTDPQRAAAGVQPQEMAAARENAAEVSNWIGLFVGHLQGDQQ